MTRSEQEAPSEGRSQQALEDKVVRWATAAVLSAVYEEDFGFSYRPKRRQHDELDAPIVGISSGNPAEIGWFGGEPTEPDHIL